MATSRVDHFHVLFAKCFFSFLLLTEQSHSSKQLKAEEDDTNAEDREYEEWKQRIIESATKALSAEKKTKKTKNS